MTLEWDPSPDAWVVGYALHYGTASGDYSVRVDAGNTTSATLTNLAAGTTYYIVATAYTAEGLESPPSNEISYTVLAPNQSPVAEAGPSLLVTLPDTIPLTGSVSDDGLPSTGSLTSCWTVVSGPGVVVFQDASKPSTTAAFTVAGNYVLRLSTTDGEFTAQDEVAVTVSAKNTRPTVEAGPLQSITLPNAVVLSGSVTDDGLPTIGSMNSSWSVVSGPGEVTFQDASAPTTIVAFSLPGAYLLRLTATDGELNAFDEVSVTVAAVVAPPNTNQPPASAASGSVTLEWDPSPDAWVVGYALHHGTSSGSYSVRVDVGNSTSATLTNLTAGTTYYIVATAYTAEGFESPPSNEISYTVPQNAVIPANQAPAVEAGTNLSVTLPDAVVLTGSVADDGLPTSGSLISSWSVISGPGEVAFQHIGAPATIAAFSLPGNYLLRLTTADGELTASDEVAITVMAQNQPPTVDAGPNRSLKPLPDAIILRGNVTDDALPLAGKLNSTWSVVSGPGTVTFANANAPTTAASFSVAGDYVLRLTATDGELTAYDEISAVVAAINQPPTVEAGPNQSVTLPATVALAGLATDDGLPSSTNQLSVGWYVVSGPGPVVFNSPAKSTTSAGFAVAGTYVFRLTAADGELMAHDEVTVTVASPSPENGVGLVIEAESGAITQPMTVSSATFANQETHYIHTSGPGEGSAMYGFQVREAGTYLVWARVMVTGDTNNTLFVSGEGGPEFILQPLDDSTASNTWQWVLLDLPLGGTNDAALSPAPPVFEFEAGNHLLSVRGTQTGLLLDKFVVTNDRNYIPTESAAQVSPPSIATLIFEEDGAQVTWNAQPGATYRLVYKDNLTDTQWLPASPDLVAVSNTLSWQDETAGFSSRRFYSVALVR